MRRLLSVSAAGAVLCTGVVPVAANAAASEANFDTSAKESSPALFAYHLKNDSKLNTWGVPANIVVHDKEEQKEEAWPTNSDEELQLELVSNTVEEITEPAVAEEATAPAVDYTPAEEATAPVEEAPAEVAQTAETAAYTQSSATTAVADTPAWTASNSASRDAVVNAAQGYAAVNAQTDCTMLVTNSLRAIGINFHGWPAEYQSLGTIVSADQAKPGDLIYYASNGYGQSHIAVYLGNGQAVHGGWNGMGTTVFSANLPSASAPIFISLSAYNG